LLDFRQTTFLHAAQNPGQWPTDSGAEVAFAGRSNVGKSSAINLITGHRGLARTSKTPGRTQQIVFFSVNAAHRLVDLPGYGFAKVPLSVREHWDALMASYFNDRDSLRGLILCMDARRPLTATDQTMLNWCLESGLPAHILLTKCDKLSRGAAANTVRKITKDLAASPCSVQLFSSTTKTGVDQARGVLAQWLTKKNAV
jgi:GTP-binding protein